MVYHIFLKGLILILNENFLHQYPNILVLVISSFFFHIWDREPPIYGSRFFFIYRHIYRCYYIEIFLLDLEVNCIFYRILFPNFQSELP